MQLIQNPGCRMCGHDRFTTVIDMGLQPLVNSLVGAADLGAQDPAFPLVVKRCDRCALVQIVEIVPAQEIYKNVDYLFFSSDMPGLSDYFKKYVDEDVKRFLSPDDLVVEIGSNDGVLLKHLRDGYRVLGVDPSTNVALRAVKNGIPTMPLFFSERLAGQIRFEWGKAKAVVANNCIAHLNDLDDLMMGVAKLLDDDGVFILECNYWGGMVKNTNYSLIYHDHYSYFSLDVWRKFAPEYGLRPFDAWVTPAQGGSLRLFLCKDGRPETERMQALAREEQETKLGDVETGERYCRNVHQAATALRRKLDQIKSEGKTIAGYGAAAKGFTILAMSKVGKGHIDYFVDDSPAKQGLYTPVEHVPIISRREAETRLPDVFLVLAPNYADVIIRKEADFLEAGGKIVVPYGHDIRTYPE